jgi:IS30 family transposase
MTRHEIQQDPERHWSVKEVADYFGVSCDTIRREMDDGYLIGIWIRGACRIKGHEIIRYEQWNQQRRKRQHSQPAA